MIFTQGVHAGSQYLPTGWKSSGPELALGPSRCRLVGSSLHSNLRSKFKLQDAQPSFVLTVCPVTRVCVCRGRYHHFSPSQWAAMCKPLPLPKGLVAGGDWVFEWDPKSFGDKKVGPSFG